MRSFFVALCLVVLVAPASSGLAWPRSVGRSDSCTVWAVRSDLLVTASHCVTVVGDTRRVAMPRGIGWLWHDAVVVWDGLTRAGDWAPDVALLRPSLPWHDTLPVARYIHENVACVTLSHPDGMERLRGACVVYGLAREENEWWVMWYGDRVAPGSSGGPVLVNGQVVASIVGGSPEWRMFRGAAAGDIARAIREYDGAR